MEGVRRGDVVTVSAAGDYGKPRPALVVQADAFAAIPSVTVLPMTSEIHAEHLVRITIRASAENGLRAVSQVMVDKIITVPGGRVASVIGHAEAETLATVSAALARFLGLA